MSDSESETLNAHIHNGVASSGPGMVIFAVIVAAQLIFGALGFVLDHFTMLDHRFDRTKTPPGAMIQPTNR
jgi:hypothetical protein